MSADHEHRVSELAAALDLLGQSDLPGHTVDQLGAAATEANTLLRRLSAAAAILEPDRRWGPIESDDRDAAREAVARVFLALSGSSTCQHLRHGGPQSATCRLALHRIDCARCVRTVRLPPKDEADRCDWCGTREVETFWPIALATGPLLALGDACTSCGTALRSLTEEALLDG